MLPSSRKFWNTTLLSSSVKASEQFFLQLSPHGSLKSFLFFNIVSPFLFFVSYASITSVRFSFRHCSFPFFWVHFFLFSSPLNGGIASVPDDSEKSTKFDLITAVVLHSCLSNSCVDVHVEPFPFIGICQHFCNEKSYCIVFDLLSMQCAVIYLLRCCFEYLNTISHQLNFVTVVEGSFFSFQMRVLGETFRWSLVTSY